MSDRFKKKISITGNGCKWNNMLGPFSDAIYPGFTLHAVLEQPTLITSSFLLYLNIITGNCCEYNNKLGTFNNAMYPGFTVHAVLDQPTLISSSFLLYLYIISKQWTANCPSGVAIMNSGYDTCSSNLTYCKQQSNRLISLKCLKITYWRLRRFIAYPI